MSIFSWLIPELARIERKLAAMTSDNAADFAALVERLDAVHTNLAGDIARLKDAIVPGMSQAEVDEVKVALDAVIDKLEATADETPEE